MKKETDKFSNFMIGFAASAQLLQRAVKNGFFVEYTCLAASIIDGLLRIGLILKHQLETSSDIVIDSLLYQADEDKIISERKVYKMALSKFIITKELFDKLNDLYDQRNRVIHRYIISDITTKEVLRIGMQYEIVISEVSKSVKKLEDEQVKKNIGMTREGDDTIDKELANILKEMRSEKHDDAIISHTLNKKGL